MQPPSGGCVLKQVLSYFALLAFSAAAFGRLCVETVAYLASWIESGAQPPSGGCVLKHLKAVDSVKICTQPPSGGCVLKQQITD